MSHTITIQQLPSTEAPPPEAVVVHLPMTAHDRRRVRRLIDAPDGARLALQLATGTVLLPGQVLTGRPRAPMWSRRHWRTSSSRGRETSRKRDGSDI